MRYYYSLYLTLVCEDRNGDDKLVHTMIEQRSVTRTKYPTLESGTEALETILGALNTRETCKPH